MKRISKPISLCALLLNLLVGTNSFAALGEPAISSSTVNSKTAKVSASYSVQETMSDANTIKEFIDQKGIVFAIAWRGIDHPDFSVILGSYYAGYQAEEAAKEKVHGKRQSEIKRENLVVQKWGNMRSLQGRAYDPSLVPAGVSINEIK